MHEMITPREAAKMMRVKVGTLAVWRQRGKGPPSYRLVGSVRYRRDEVEAWIEERKAR